MIIYNRSGAVDTFFVKALAAIGEDRYGMDELLPLVTETGKANLACMELLDKANTETYGTPAPVTVPLSVEPGPFIIVSGHDLHDLKLLLEQTDGAGINVYTRRNAPGARLRRTEKTSAA